MKTKKAKHIFAVVMCLMLSFSIMFGLTTITASAASGGTDVIFVIDDTRSMLQTDPNKLTSVAINKFVDILPSNSDIRLGIATYSVDVMRYLELGQTVPQIKDFSKTNILQDGKGTDAAVGLNWAVNELQAKSDNTRKRAIILVGDGENSFIVGGKAVRTDADSNAVRDAAVAAAQSNGIAVYTLAINPVADNFRQYFANIATATSGSSYEPKSADELDVTMKDIYGKITGTDLDKQNPIDLQPGQPFTQEITVPDGVFEMGLQCDHTQAVEIYFTDPNGTIYNESSEGVTCAKESTYTTFKIHEPAEGLWKVTYKSDVQQTIVPYFILHADLIVSLSKNQNDIMQQKPVQYIATVMTNGAEITDDNSLSGFNANLVITEIDDQGNAGKPQTEKMSVSNGKFLLEHAIKNPGKYEIYTEIVGGQSSIKSNTLTIDVAVDPSIMPLWQKLLIIGGVLFLIILIIIVVSAIRSKPGGGLVRGNVSIKILGRQLNDDTMIFPQDRFDCIQTFGKKNTLSDLVTAYVRRYRLNNTSELAEMTLMQFINSTFSEVTDKVSICGNKKRQTIVKIPTGYEMQVDGVEISKPKTLAFSSYEKSIELCFKNQGCAYTVNLVFTRE